MKDDLPPETQKLLELAELVRRGHCKFSLAMGSRDEHCDPWDEDVAKVCLIGGLYRVFNVRPGRPLDGSFYDCWRRLADVLGSSEGGVDFVGFNNAPETTAEDVAQVCERAAFLP